MHRSFTVLPAVTGMPLGAARLDAQQGHTMFRADPAHWGVHEVAPVTTLGGLRWRFAAGGLFRFDAGAAVTSSPAVGTSAVYFVNREGTALDRELLR